MTILDKKIYNKIINFSEFDCFVSENKSGMFGKEVLCQ